MAAMKAMKAVKAMKAMKAMKMKGSDEDCTGTPPEAYPSEPVQALALVPVKAMKKGGSGVHRDRVFLKRTTKSLKRIEQEFWRKLKSRLKYEVAAEYEQTIQNLKQRLASEVLAEFDFCRLFPWPPVSIHFICMGGRSHIPEGLGLEAGPLDGKNYISYNTWILVVPGEERAEEGTTTREKVGREICVPEPMYLSLRI